MFFKTFFQGQAFNDRQAVFDNRLGKLISTVSNLSTSPLLSSLQYNLVAHEIMHKEINRYNLFQPKEK